MKRILRVIEYVGDDAWVDDQINNRGLKGTKVLSRGTIREAIVGETGELLEATLTGSIASK